MFSKFDAADPTGLKEDSDYVSDCETILDEGGSLEDSDAEFLERAFRPTEAEADAVLGDIRNVIDPTRLAISSSLRNGVVTVQWKDDAFFTFYYFRSN